MARYLSRAELSCIAGKYIEMYYALFGISKNDPAPINPEQFANSVLGLNLKIHKQRQFPYMEICRCLFYDDPVSLCFFALASSISIFS